MQVKKYEAETLQEALDTIKRELGPDAVILQTRKNKKGFGILSKGSVEVTAAVSDVSTQKKRIAESYLQDQQRTNFRNAPAEQQREFLEEVMEKRARAYPDRVEISRNSPRNTSHQNQATLGGASSPAPVATNYSTNIMADQYRPTAAKPQIGREMGLTPSEVPALKKMVAELEGQIRHMKRQLEEVRKEVTGDFDSDAEEQVYQMLFLQGIDRKLAVELVKKAQFEIGDELAMLSGQQRRDAIIDELANEILKEIEVNAQPFAESKLHWFSGSHGVGKTTTLLKISESLKAQNLKVGIVVVGNEQDLEKIASQAKVLDVPVRLVKESQDWKAVLADFSGLDKILVESNESGAHQINHLKELASFHPKTHIITSILEKESVGLQQIRGLLDNGLTSVIVTHLDQAQQFGGLLNLFRRAKVPYSYFSTGRKIQDDLELATPERVAALVLDIKPDNGGSGP